MSKSRTVMFCVFTSFDLTANTKTDLKLHLIILFTKTMAVKEETFVSSGFLDKIAKSGLFLTGQVKPEFPKSPVNSNLNY